MLLLISFLLILSIIFIIIIDLIIILLIVVLIDSGANMNCIQEGLIPVKYYEQIGQELFAV